MDGQVFYSYAKVNVFLKIIGIREKYHELSSRFVLIRDLYDEMSFVRKTQFETSPLVLDGDFGCDLYENTIWKAYSKLNSFLKDRGKIEELSKVTSFLNRYKIVVKKNIPTGGGLGGGSSNAATFLRMLNDVLGLELGLGTLWQIGAMVGADVNFFLSGWESANVRGIGEKIERIEEDVMPIEIFFPKILCKTSEVFKKFDELFWDSENVDLDFVRDLELMSTKKILASFDIQQLNDLYLASLEVYPNLKKYSRDGWFFSGSGSSFFRFSSLLPLFD